MVLLRVAAGRNVCTVLKRTLGYWFLKIPRRRLLFQPPETGPSVVGGKCRFAVSQHQKSQSTRKKSLITPPSPGGQEGTTWFQTPLNFSKTGKHLITPV